MHIECSKYVFHLAYTPTVSPPFIPAIIEYKEFGVENCNAIDMYMRVNCNWDAKVEQLLLNMLSINLLIVPSAEFKVPSFLSCYNCHVVAVGNSFHADLDDMLNGNDIDPLLIMLVISEMDNLKDTVTAISKLLNLPNKIRFVLIVQFGAIVDKLFRQLGRSFSETVVDIISLPNPPKSIHFTNKMILAPLHIDIINCMIPDVSMDINCDLPDQLKVQLAADYFINRTEVKIDLIKIQKAVSHSIPICRQLLTALVDDVTRLCGIARASISSNTLITIAKKSRACGATTLLLQLQQEINRSKMA